MRDTVVQISPQKCGFQAQLALDKGFSDALRDFARRRWPHHTAKYAAREWDLTLSEGRGIADGTASKTTVERVFKRGGLMLGILILEEVTGQRLADIYRDIRGGIHETEDRAFALARESMPWRSARPADPAADPVRDGDAAVPDRRRLG